MKEFSVISLIVSATIGFLYFNSPFMGAAIFLGLFMYYPRYREMKEEKRKRELLLQFKDLLYSISASMVLGRNMKQSLEESIIFWHNIYDEKDMIIKEVREMIREMDETHETDVKVLRNFALRSGLPDIVDFVNVYESCKITGGDMPRAISRATEVIGDKITMEKEMDLALSEKRVEGRIVGLAPFVMTLAMRVLSPEYMSSIYESSFGLTISGLSLGLSVIALLMIERINRIEF